MSVHIKKETDGHCTVGLMVANLFVVAHEI